MKKVTAFGNPLLDTTVYITNAGDSLLRKYNLSEDGHKEIGQDEIARISKDLSRFKHHTSAGGCSQNTLRVLQWINQRQCEAIYFGSVGNDREALILKALLNADGVTTRYIPQDYPTGRTIGLVNGGNRSFVACLGAAQHLSIENFLAMDDFEDVLSSSDLVYIEGFFLVGRLEAATFLLDLCKRYHKRVLFNLCGEYVCERYPQEVKYFIEHANIVFGSKKEYTKLVAMLGHNCITDINKYLFKQGVDYGKYGKIALITDGPNQGSLISNNGEVTHFDVPQLPDEDIVDTVGAGDAFVGGFIAGLINDMNIDGCIKIACYAARQIIKQSGCTLPNFVPDVIN